MTCGSSSDKRLLGNGAPVVSDNLAGPLRSGSQSRRPIVIAEKSAETLATANGGARTRRSNVFDQCVAEPLMVAFAVIAGIVEWFDRLFAV
jgi:hypothetical protein